MKTLLLITLLLATTVLFAKLPALSPDKFTVCSITINSSEERELFKKEMDPKHFNPMVELTSLGGEDDWFDKACESGVRCDQLLISAHFRGVFTSEVGDKYLGLETLEQHSCNKSCQGVLNSPYDVFLLGCNTLAGKGDERRTREDYYKHLLEIGVAPSEARVATAYKYDLWGDSYKNRMEKIFSGNDKNIYGYSSSGPSGKTVTPFLKKYFKKMGNLNLYLQKQQAKRVMKEGFEMNKLLSSVMPAETSFTQCQASKEGFDKRVCDLFDPELSFNRKLLLFEELLISEQLYSVLPSLVKFYEQDVLTRELDREQKKIWDSLKKREEVKISLRKAFLESEYIVGKLKVLAMLKALGEKDRAEFQQNLINEILKQPPSAVLAETFCESKVSFSDLNPADLKESYLRQPHALEVITCLSNVDPKIEEIIIGQLEKLSPSSPELMKVLSLKKINNETFVIKALDGVLPEITKKNIDTLVSLESVLSTQFREGGEIEKFIFKRIKSEEPLVQEFLISALADKKISSDNLDQLLPYLESSETSLQTAALNFYRNHPSQEAELMAVDWLESKPLLRVYASDLFQNSLTPSTRVIEKISALYKKDPALLEENVVMFEWMKKQPSLDELIKKRKPE